LNIVNEFLFLVLGSGKSTLSKTVARKLSNFERISFDGILAARHGIYGVDYDASEHEKYADEADALFYETAEDLLSEGARDVILDRAFYAKEDRDLYESLIEKYGGRKVLVYLSAPKSVLWERIQARRTEGINADCMLEISKDLLDMFYDNFEVPSGEGEIVVDTTKL
jgi:predicted kinase